MKVKVSWKHLLLVLPILLAVDSRKYKTLKDADQRLDLKYQKLAALSIQNNFIQHLPTEKFVNFFVDPPRNYSAFVLFNTGNLNCPQCSIARREIEYLASQYAKNGEANGGSFFLEVLAENQREIMRMVGIGPSNLPVLFHFPPEGTLQNLKEFDLSVIDGDNALEVIAQWIASVSGIQIDIPRKHDPVNENDTFEPAIMKYLAIALFICHTYQRRRLILDLLLNHTSTVTAIATIAMTCYFTSGNLFNRIKNVPLIGQSASGQLQFIYSSAKSQFGAETFLIFVLYCCSTACVITLIEVKSQAKGKWSAAIGIGSLVIALTCFNILNKMYTNKLGQ